MTGQQYVEKLIAELKGMGLDMEYFPADGQCVEMWQYDGFGERDLYITITWSIGRVDVGIDAGDESYSFGGLAPNLSDDLPEIKRLVA